MIVGTILSASSVSVVKFTDDAIVLEKYGAKKHKTYKKRIKRQYTVKNRYKKVKNDALITKDELNLSEE